MRTAEKFAAAMERIRTLCRFHDKPFWIVPAADDYGVSSEQVRPLAQDLPQGTSAVLWRMDDAGEMHADESVESEHEGEG